jgi:serine/threonine protein kinase
MINNLRGGKFVAKGSFGCVYKNPSLKCRGQERSYVNVSKLMKRQDAINEMKEYDIIDAIDNKFLYHYSKPKFCDSPAKPDVSNDRMFIDCSIYKNNKRGKNNLKDLVILEQEDGGLSLLDMLDEFDDRMIDLERTKSKAEIRKMREIEFITLFYSMENLFIGLVEMNNNNYSHRDIKNQNIVAKPLDNKYDVRYIDWGRGNTHNSWKTFEDNFYFVNPPEMFVYSDYIINYIVKSYKEGYSKNRIQVSVAKAVVSSYNNSYASKVVSQNMADNLSVTENPYTSINIEEHVNFILNANKSKGKKRLKDIKVKSDVFGLGINMLMIWSGFLGFVFMPYVYEDDKFCSRVNDYPDILKEINILIQRMCISGLKDRYLPSEAYEHFNNIKEMILSEEKFSSLSEDDSNIKEELSSSEKICNQLKKTVDPKCEDQSHCIWIKNEGCKNKVNSQSPEEVNTQSPEEVKCPRGKVLNPLTGKCIKINGARAKQLRKEGIID